MRYFLIVSFSIFHLLSLSAQSICDNFQMSTDSSEIFIPAAADLRLNNQTLPTGSILVAIDPLGNCCSSPTIWQEQDLNIRINGQNFLTEGYINNDLLRLLVSSGDSCFVEVDSVYFTVNDSTQVASFAYDSLYVMSSFNAIDTFGIDSTLLDNPMCEDTLGGAQIFVSGGQLPYTYQWSHDSLAIFDQLFNLPLGNYQVTATDKYGCFDTTSFDIILDPPPIEFEFQIDSSLSVCDTVVLSNLFPCVNCFYNWNNGTFADEFVVTEEGLYTVVVIKEGCFKSDSIYIDFLDDPEVEILTNATTVCPGDTILLSATGAINYNWSSVGNLLSLSGPSIEAVITENTSIQVIGDNNCKADTASIEIDVFDLPNAGEDKCFAQGNQPVQLDASGSVEYLWEFNPVGPVSDDSISDPFVTPTGPTDYIVSFVDDNGCESADTVFVEFIEDILDFTTLFNVITPNGDGKNDVLFFDAAEKANSSSLLVYDRRKKIVYESENYNNDWGGTFKGSRLPAGTYYYVLTINGTPFQSNLSIIYE